jgi:hypothetical protein
MKFARPPEVFSFPVRELSDWSIETSMCPPERPLVGAALPRDDRGPVRVWKPERDSSPFFLQFADLIGASIDTGRKSVRLWPLDKSLSRNTVEHFLYDHVAPRLLAEGGPLVLHAAAVDIQGLLVALLGPSGAGKSTLSAGFQKQGCSVLGDDALSVRFQPGEHFGSSLYPSLRLLPDSVSHLFPGGNFTSIAQYSIKRDVREAISHGWERPPTRVSAIFFLEPPGETGRITVRDMGGAEACIGLVENSFALDPTNVFRAQERLRCAAALTNAARIYAIAYPRDYAFLAEVCQRIIKEVISHQITKQEAGFCG